MNKWQNTELGLGYPLSRQQLFLAKEGRKKEVDVLYFCKFKK